MPACGAAGYAHAYLHQARKPAAMPPIGRARWVKMTGRGRASPAFSISNLGPVRTTARAHGDGGFRMIYGERPPRFYAAISADIFGCECRRRISHHWLPRELMIALDFAPPELIAHGRFYHAPDFSA